MNFGDSTSFGNSFNYPAARPRHELNLIRNRSIPPEYTFTRNSAGTYVGPDGLIKTANANQPRFDYDPITKEFKGLLIEESRTNIDPYSLSQPASSITGLNQNISITTGAIAPNKTSNFRTFTTTSSTNILRSYYSDPISVTAGQIWTNSIYVDANNSSAGDMIFAIGNAGSQYLSGYMTINANKTISVSFPTAGQAHLAIFTPISSGYQSLGNNIYRVWYIYSLVNTETRYMGMGLYPNFNQPLGWSISVWGSQVELGSSPTSYIPTSGSTVTRLADQLILNKSLSTSGTFFVEARPTTGTTLVADNGTNSYYISPTRNIITKNALYYNTNRVLIMSSSNTSTLGQSTNYQSTSGLNRVSLGFDRLNNTNYINGHIKNFKYYDSPITEDNLRSLTGSNKNISRVADGLIVTSGLVLNLDAGNRSSYSGSGTTWTDLSGNGRNFTLYNSSYYSFSSSNGGSIGFTRTMPPTAETGGYAEHIGSGALAVTTYLYNNHTTEIWARINDRNPTNHTVNEIQSALFVYRGWHCMFYYGSSALTYTVYDGATTARDAVKLSIGTSGTDIIQGTWFNAVVTRNGNIFSTYINGVLKGSITLTTSSSGVNTTNSIRIGMANPSGEDFSWHADANVSCARMYNRALSATEVQQNFNALRGRFGI